MKIYLDNLRSPPEGWLLVKDAPTCIDIISKHWNNITDISLDHDLGDDTVGTGYSVLLFIEKQVLEFEKIPSFNITVHSANTRARVKMELAINSIFR